MRPGNSGNVLQYRQAGKWGSTLDVGGGERKQLTGYSQYSCTVCSCSVVCVKSFGFV